jgi:hypothetical protein
MPFFEDLVGNLNSVSPSVARYKHLEDPSCPMYNFTVTVNFGIPFISGRSTILWSHYTE